MNDRHPSGTLTTPTTASEAASAPYASYGSQEAQYDGYATYDSGFDAQGSPGVHSTDAHTSGFHASGAYTQDFAPSGADHGSPADHGTAHAYATGTYGTTQWATGTHHTLHYDPYAAQHHAAYDTGAYDTTNWSAGYEQLSAIPQQTSAPDTSGQWDASAWLQPDPSGSPADQTQQWDWNAQGLDQPYDTGTFDTGAYDATQWNSDGDTAAPDAHEQGGESFDQQVTSGYEDAPGDDGLTATGELPAVEPGPLLDEQEETAPAPRAATRSANRSRRRPPPKRSALLTVAVPSVCVMGVAGIAAASVGTFTDDGKETSASAAETKSVKPSAANNTLDTQLETLSAEADNFADRASRTQERIDLKAQQEAERKKAAAEAARKERLRPKYALPVATRGLSAYFGQSGVNWMSLHTGIDFPVSYGTTVMAATDGTVRTQWNSAYGNMMIITAKDGTETWYCHLSSYRVPSGTTVKAGEPVAYSGNSGNSTGPHLHFEVRPGGGSAIDPLPWLRSHGLDPT
ncbi:M23 family metallopeptidase [Streptomyces longwoodensis]|uniref:M23 family metallopeptidase n=1 Tax=Streptomyces longwoodensis TaxID=68231 RepID=UPI002256AB0C|nr:M23 family metallopeptidase [Streptomyces longwoodensis]MCX4995450.1 M23 family metallopeptidase [Streptomyces longwoodensis]WUC58286.1 M23 family metallopeptidase [Streptomyces longwoodensis]WUC71773.1 M23 family metallopeptidase [Streptomyces longwoodensis]